MLRQGARGLGLILHAQEAHIMMNYIDEFLLDFASAFVPRASSFPHKGSEVEFHHCSWRVMLLGQSVMSVCGECFEVFRFLRKNHAKSPRQCRDEP